MFNKNLKFTGLVTAGMVMGILAMAAPAGAAQSINAVDGRKHSTSEKLTLNTGMPGS